MHKMISFILLVLLTGSVVGQSQIERMLKQKRYRELAEMAPRADDYSGKDIFHIGQAFIMIGEDQKAVEMFNKAINKGYQNGELYFAKGIAESNLEFYETAIESFEQALYYLPMRKKVLIELAAAYYKDVQLDSAYATYYKVAENWGDYYPALLMLCQISHEQEKYTKALDCYYEKLPIFKKDPYYYREALEAIVRLQWHHFESYYKAEEALKNLLNTFPDDFGYQMQLMQLYNYTGRYADAAAIENYILKGYSDLKLDNSYYQKGVMLVDQFDTAQYHIEAFRVFQPEKMSNCNYKSFIFNYDGSRSLGKIEAFRTDTLAYLRGYALDSIVVLDSIFSYQTVKNAYLKALFQPDTNQIDSTMTD
jgi:tetratricopeptide (TPR) repeat protein